jgi:hypothetical protein
MQSGVYWGYIGLVEGIVRQIRAERDRPMKVVATGGLAPLFEQGTDVFDAVEDDLTMHGLVLIHRPQQGTGNRMTANRLIYLPLGGAGEIGMNCYVYGYGPEGRERLIVVDLGVTFPDMDTTPGVDLIMPNRLAGRTRRPDRGDLHHPRATKTMSVRSAICGRAARAGLCPQVHRDARPAEARGSGASGR